MQTLGLLFLAFIAPVTFAQTTNWTSATDTKSVITPTLIVEHSLLRDYIPSGRLIKTTNYGPLLLEIREMIPTLNSDGTTQVKEPASITVRYRNRLLAAASGYRLGGEFTQNGVVIESWDGNDKCSYLKWKLVFTGERLTSSDPELIKLAKCS